MDFQPRCLRIPNQLLLYATSLQKHETEIFHQSADNPTLTHNTASKDSDNPPAKRQCTEAREYFHTTGLRFCSTRAGSIPAGRHFALRDGAGDLEGCKQSDLAGGRLLDIFHMATNSAPESGIQDPPTADSASTSLDWNQIGIGELLDLDETPAFVIDAEACKNDVEGRLRLLFCNNALKQESGLVDLLQGSHKAHLHASRSTQPYSEFRAWAIRTVEDLKLRNVSLPSCSYGGILWVCSAILRKRLRIFRGHIENSHKSRRANAENTGPKDQQHQSTSANSSISKPPLPHDSETSFASRPPTEGLELNSYGLEGADPDLRETDIQKARHSSKESQPAGRIQELQNTGPSQHLTNEAILRAASAGDVDTFGRGLSNIKSLGFFDWTRLPLSNSLPRHVQFARSIEWSRTSLGPIENWPTGLREMCNLIMASPHPAAMYWGKDFTAIYNESYIMLAGQKHPRLMGMSYREAWSEIWDGVKDVFANALSNAQATMKDDDQLFIRRNNFLEETYFSW